MADDKAFTLVGATPSVAIDFDLVSLDADGFTINLTTTNGTAVRIGYVALGGDDLDAAVGTVTQPVGTGADAVTGVGLQPMALIFFGTGATTLNVANSSPQFTIGFATRDSASYSGISSADRAAASACRSWVSTTHCVGSLNDTNGATLCEAKLDSMDADGFTLNWTTIDGSQPKFFFIALNITTLVGGGVSGRGGWMWVG